MWLNRLYAFLRHTAYDGNLVLSEHRPVTTSTFSALQPIVHIPLHIMFLFFNLCEKSRQFPKTRYKSNLSVPLIFCPLSDRDGPLRYEYKLVTRSTIRVSECSTL